MSARQQRKRTSGVFCTCILPELLRQQYLALANLDMDLLCKMHIGVTHPMFNKFVWVKRNDLVET